MKKSAAQLGIWGVSTLRIFGSARPSRLVPACGAVALFATALFFLLHHLGNQLPYDLAMQRFKTELESNRPDPGHAKGYKTMYEHCEMSAAVLAGARQASRAAGNESAFRRAVVLRDFSWSPLGPCANFEAAVNGAAVAERILKTRYWFGSKALYAIALRYGSVYDVRKAIGMGTYVAYFLLAISLFLLSPKMFLPAMPLLVFGAFFSGIHYWSDLANGLPYLWTVLFAAGLAVFTSLAGPEAPRRWKRGPRHGAQEDGRASSAVEVYCFAGGTVSSYLWLGEGHTFLAATWIGMVVWLGSSASDVAERTRKAMLCIALYGAGIVVCYILGQVLKAMFLGADNVWSSFWIGLVVSVKDSVGSPASTVYPPVYLDYFYAAYWPGSWPSGIVPTAVAASSLTISFGLAAFEARRGRYVPLWSVLWIVGLMAACSLTFLISEDLHYRTARYVFVPLALCYSCLMLSLKTMHWRMSPAEVGKLSALLLGLLVVVGAVSWYFAMVNSRAVAKVVESVEDVRPIASSTFDMYLDENRLVYVKEECSDEDVDAPFFLHLHPVDIADLGPHRRPHGYDNLDFSFWRYGLRGNGRCAAERPLRDYRIASIDTGQYMPGEEGRKWSERIVLPGAVDKVIESVDDMRLAARSAFDVYLDENRLVYFKEECGDEDVDAPFFLHLRAVDVAELPLDRQQHGFDNLDFLFGTSGFHDGRRCAVERPLPDYRIASIDTGQYVPGEGRKWQARIAPGAVDKMIGSVEDMRPAASSAFDVYLDGNRLVYVKEECSYEDVEAPFFLHLRAVDVAELPLDRQQHGFDNLDFLFGTFGFHDGRRCAAERLLPDYRVASIDTGQYVPGESRLWSETIGLQAP